MVYITVVKRTQLYLDEDMARLLAAESHHRGTTVSELVRDAVARTYGRHRPQNRREIIDRLAGVWADRDDLGTTEEFVRSLRDWTARERRVGGSVGEVPPRQRRRDRVAQAGRPRHRLAARTRRSG
jgi:predicted nucleic acid-binding protein